MEANGKLATKFVELLNGYSLEMNYEKPEVVKKGLCNGFNLKSMNGTCPMKQVALAENGCNGTLNGHLNGTLNGQLNGHVNGHLNGDSNDSDDHDESNNKENGNHKKPLHYQEYLMVRPI